jgi:hypothetical protein
MTIKRRFLEGGVPAGSAEELRFAWFVLVQVAHGIEHGAQEAGGGNSSEPARRAVGLAKVVAKVTPSHRRAEQ